MSGSGSPRNQTITSSASLEAENPAKNSSSSQHVKRDSPASGRTDRIQSQRNSKASIKPLSSRGGSNPTPNIEQLQQRNKSSNRSKLNTSIGASPDNSRVTDQPRISNKTNDGLQIQHKGTQTKQKHFFRGQSTNAGDTSKTNRLLPRRIVPLGDKSRNFPQIFSDGFGKSGTELKLAAQHSATESRTQLDKSAQASLRGEDDLVMSNVVQELRNRRLSAINEVKDLLYDCWRCGRRVQACVVGEPSLLTHLTAAALCLTCLTPCVFVPYWLQFKTTPTKRCSECGAYLTEPPPRGFKNDE